MKYIPVESTNLTDIAHDATTNTLSVVFKGRTAYFYPGVPVEVFDRFVAAESKGRFFNAEVKDKYAFFTLEGIELFPSGTQDALNAAHDAISKLP